MKRYALTLVLPISLLAASCSSTTDAPDSAGGLSAAELAKNPIQGIAAAKVLLDTGQYTDGPVWHAGEKVLFYTVPLGAGDIPGLYRARPDGSAMKVRGGVAATGELPVGNAVNKNGDLVTVEAKRVMRGGAGAEPGLLASGYPGDKGVTPFDTLNDAVVHANGTIYVTDPGYFADPPPLSNHLYRIGPDGAVSIAETFADVPRPNGVALSPDQTVLYVGFEKPSVGTKPYVEKYHVQDDGSLAEHSRFVEFDIGASPDGIEVDQAGNVYVANAAGITVFKADGKKIGNVPVPEQPTGLAFGGDDLKTLYITTAKTKIYSVKVNVPGINQ
jgi:sugar lactone lactonase YvrE